MDRRKKIFETIHGPMVDEQLAKLIAVEVDSALPNINWRPIEELPEELKDEGQLLALSWWVRGILHRGRFGYWADEKDNHWTHFCEINAPEGK